MTARRRPRVRVQSSAHGHELIVDETFASFHRTDGPATHCVWDAIAAPALALGARRPPHVLVLGFGGGSAARIVRALHPEARIEGVEIDADVVAAARTHFGVDALDVTLHVEDALAFLERARVESPGGYDLILEDVFIGRGDAVHKPDWIPHPAHDLVRRCLRPRGILVSNTIDEAATVQSALCQAFPGVLRIDVEDYDNRILVASRAPLSARDLRGRIAASPVLRDSLSVLRLRTVQSPSSPDAGSSGAGRAVSAPRRGTAGPPR
jgi:spermidine synthase